MQCEVASFSIFHWWYNSRPFAKIFFRNSFKLHFWIYSSLHLAVKFFFLKILVKAELAACLNDNLVGEEVKKERHPRWDILEVVCQAANLKSSLQPRFSRILKLSSLRLLLLLLAASWPADAATTNYPSKLEESLQAKTQRQIVDGPSD